MANRVVVILGLIGCITLLPSCELEEQRKKEIIAEGVEIKIDQFVARRERICREEAIDKAMVIVDSILRVEGLDTRIKPVEKPPVAQKPGKPTIKTLPDSLGMQKLREN